MKRALALLFILFAIKSSWAQEQKDNQPANLKYRDGNIGIFNILFSGVLLKNADKNQVWYIPNAFELFPANTVEGFVFNPQVRFTQNYGDGRFLSLTPNLRYGFGNERFQAQLKTQYFYRPESNGLLEISGGRAIEQIYDESTLSAFNNTLNTYAFNDNFLKIYERTYMEVAHSFSPLKHFLLTTTLSWNERNPLDNLVRFEEDEGFTSNDPENIELENTAFAKHQAVIFDASLRWQIGHHLTKQRGQLVSEGKYPALTLSYTNAIDGILGGDVSYQKLAFNVQDDFKTGYYSKGSIYAAVGDFLSNDNATFVDFNHFKGKETVYGPYGDNQFQLLEYYTNSTADFYIQGYFEHYFTPFYFIKDELRFQPTVGINYLYTEAGGHYVELGIGMDKMFGSDWRIDLYNSWRDGEHESFGLRIGLDLL